MNRQPSGAEWFGQPVLHNPLTVARQEFLVASIAVWRHLDEHGRCPASSAFDEGIALRKREKAAWEAYRDLLAATGQES